MNVYANISVGPNALLVAAPSILDPHFARTVVRVLRHDSEDGTLGVVINRPLSTLEADVEVALGQWLEDSVPPQRVFEGGPVSAGSFLCLAEDPDGLRSVDLMAEEPASLPGRWRIFRGYAGWAPGQLAAEVDDAGWYVVPSEPDDVFSSDPQSLWRTVLSRQSGEVRMFAEFPDDPSYN